MGDMNGIPSGQTVESMAAYHEAVAQRCRDIAIEMQAENRAMRAAGRVFHECDYSESQGVMSSAEAKSIASAYYAALRVRFPGKWVGDPQPRQPVSEVPEIAEIERVYRSRK